MLAEQKMATYKLRWCESLMNNQHHRTSNHHNFYTTRRPSPRGRALPDKKLLLGALSEKVNVRIVVDECCFYHMVFITPPRALRQHGTRCSAPLCIKWLSHENNKIVHTSRLVSLEKLQVSLSVSKGFFFQQHDKKSITHNKISEQK